MSSSASESGFHFLMDYLKCRQYFYWRYVKKLTPIKKAGPLIFGTAIHAGLENYYKELKENPSPTVLHRQGMIERAISTFEKNMKRDKDEYQREEYFNLDYVRGQNLLERYFLKYPIEPFTVEDIEFPLQYTFPSGDVFTGRIDLKIKQNGKYYIVDHKTTGWSMSSLGRSLGVSDQATGYILMDRIIHPDKPANGMIFNVLRNVKGVYDYGRLLVVKAPRDLERFKEDIGDLLQEISEKLTNPNTHWIKNTYACFSFGRPCPYLELCQGANYEGLIGVKYKIEEAQSGDTENE